jgi:hypothetical protein
MFQVCTHLQSINFHSIAMFHDASRRLKEFKGANFKQIDTQFVKVKATSAIMLA